jgi:acetate---CoA ligase (ADP-forming)
MDQLITEQYRRVRLAFDPQSAAIVGASTDPRKFGGRALKFCLDRGYAGRLYPINPGNAVVQGVRAYPTISDLPEAPDVAVIAVPAPQVADALEAAGAKGAKIGIVYGAQFAEMGTEGRARQDRLLAIARTHGMRLIGPNCMGVISLATGFVASFTTAPEHHDGEGWPEVGTVSVASQSGAVGIQIFAQLRDRGLGLANWMSTGNQADIDVADCIAAYAEDDATRIIAVYMEDASRGLKLLQALELARRARKPVVILKVGTTPEGGQAAAGHTASMYVEDRVVSDLFRQFGVLRAHSINDLIDLVAACAAGVVPAVPEVAVISVSGGGAVMISDAAAKHGLVLPPWRQETLAALKAANPFVNARNPIDISAPSMSDMNVTAGHLEAGVDEGHPTMLGYISHIPLVPRTRASIMPRLLELPMRRPGTLVAVAMNAHPEDRKALVGAGMAVFDDPVAATEAVGRLVATGRAFERAPVELAAPHQMEPVDAVVARNLLVRAGIAMLDDLAVATSEAAVAAAADLPGRAVLKLSAPGLWHRTELRGVRTGLGDEKAVRAAFVELAAEAEMLASRFPGIGIILQPMIEDGVEFLVGLRHDPHFGPLVTAATGGTQVELWDDLTYRKAPIDAEEADGMVKSLRGARLLDGFRDAPRADRVALVAAIVHLSRLVDDPHAGFGSLEINPLFVRPEGLGVVGADLVVG